MNLKRVISLLLVLILALGVMPAVSAADLSNMGYARGVAGVYADGCEAGTSPAYIFDGNLNTRWGSGSTTVWMKTDADVSYDHVNMAFLAGNTRRYSFKLDACGADGVWTTVFDGTSAGGTTGFERFDFGKSVSGEWLRFTGKGNSDNYWNNISEMTGVPLEVGPANLYLVDGDIARGVDEVAVAGETYLPFVAVAEACGMEVSWNESTQTVKAEREMTGRRFEGVVGSNSYTTQEGTFTTDKPLLLLDGTLLCHKDALVDFIGYYPSARQNGYHVVDLKKRIATQTDLDALAEMEKMFDPEKLLDLYVSLYDPETGGMYFSQPSVGREGFGPHIESTSQAALPISLMTTAEKQKLGSWIQSLQDPETGWFIEPEFDIATVHVGKKQRDLNSSLGILNACGMEPLYPTATERIPTEDEAEVVLMASGDVSTSDDSYLASLDNYMEWVRTEFDWDGTGQGRHVWHAGNDIGDFAPRLKELGWLDTVSEFIRSKQRPHNGLFTDEVNMIGISAVTKLSGVFTLTGIPMPYMDKIIESAAYLAETAEFGGMSEPYNISLAMRFMVQSAGEVGIDAETQAQLDAAAPRFVRSLSVKLKDFYKRDGGFGYNRYGASVDSQGAVVMPNYDASDVNATQLAKGCRNDLYWLLGMETPALYSQEEFLLRIRAKAPVTGPIVKINEDYDPADEVPLMIGTHLVTVTAEGEGYVHGADGTNNTLKLYYFPKAGYDVTGYRVDDGAVVTDFVRGDFIPISISGDCNITVIFEKAEDFGEPEIVSRAEGGDMAFVIKQRGTYWPATAFTSSLLTADETKEYTLEYKFKVDNYVAGPTAAARPIFLFNGTNSLHLAKGKAYINGHNESWGFENNELGDCAHGEWHTVSMHFYTEGGRVKTDVTLDGKTTQGITAAYSDRTAPVPQASALPLGDSQFDIPAEGVYFGVTAYSGYGADETDAYYAGFDLILDYVNLTVDGVSTELSETFSDVHLENGEIVYDDGTEKTWSLSSTGSHTFDLVGMGGNRLYANAMLTLLSDYHREAIYEGIFAIGKLRYGTADTFGILLSPDKLTGTLTKADIERYLITNSSGDEGIYAFPARVSGYDGRFGVVVQEGPDSDVYFAGKTLYVYVYAAKGDKVSYLPVNANGITFE